MKDRVFHCPECKTPLRCGCKSCIKRYGKVSGMMEYDKSGEVSICPNCKYAKSFDEWLDIEYDQLIRKDS